MKISKLFSTLMTSGIILFGLGFIANAIDSTNSNTIIPITIGAIISVAGLMLCLIFTIK